MVSGPPAHAARLLAPFLQKEELGSPGARAAQLLADHPHPPHPQPAQPLPGAGALPVGGGTWRVHTLVAAPGVEAHLAGPTLDAVLLTLVDVWAGRRVRRAG